MSPSSRPSQQPSAFIGDARAAGRGNLERRHETDRRRHFMTRRGFATELEDIVFQGDLLRQFVGNAPSPLSTTSATELKDFRHAWQSV
jgi:hypothetical protein